MYSMKFEDDHIVNFYTDFDLCEDKFVFISETMFTLLLVLTVPFGLLADQYGRKKFIKYS